MYNFIRNATLTGLSIYIIYSLNVFGSLITAVISGIIFSFVAILFETLSRISRHQSQYVSLREVANTRDLSSFKDDGEHLPSLYTYLESVSAKLIDRKNYLGDNRHVFERPYRFIKDTKYIVDRVINEIEYLNLISASSFKSADKYLFVNTRFDTNLKERYEFYLNNMTLGQKRDELISIYRKKFPKSTAEIKTTSEMKYIKDRAEKLLSIPDHLNIDFDFVNETKQKIKEREKV